MSNQTKHKRPKYTIEFKQDAAKLVNEKGYTHKEAADNLATIKPANHAVFLLWLIVLICYCL